MVHYIHNSIESIFFGSDFAVNLPKAARTCLLDSDLGKLPLEDARRIEV
jgi:hypothetical protein